MKKPAGPLSIFLETTGSSGVTGERGAAMLALVRLLNEYRPVDLWVCVTFGQREMMNGLLIRVDTRPLALAHAAHMLSSLPDTAYCGGKVLNGLGLSWIGGWSYGVPELERKWCGEIFKRFLEPGSDVLYVPAAFLTDGGASRWSGLKRCSLNMAGETMEEE